MVLENTNIFASLIVHKILKTEKQFSISILKWHKKEVIYRKMNCKNNINNNNNDLNIAKKSR